MEIWTLAWDTDNGTGASVHMTERECFEELIRDNVETENREEALRQLELDGTTDEAGEHDFFEWFAENERETLDTFSIESHKIEVPIFSGRELATVLHALRHYQERRYGSAGECVTADEDSLTCEHFAETEPLTEEEIDALCERLNCSTLRPEEPQDEAPYVPNAVELGFIEYARENLATDELEIDDGPDCKGNYPKVSQGADGAFVAAWVWVTNEQAGVEEVEEEDTDEVCPHCGEKGVAYGAHCNMVDHAEPVLIPHDPQDDEPEPDPKWTEDEWAQEVRDGNTLRGYHEWRQAKAEEETGDTITLNPTDVALLAEQAGVEL